MPPFSVAFHQVCAHFWIFFWLHQVKLDYLIKYFNLYNSTLLHRTTTPCRQIAYTSLHSARRWNFPVSGDWKRLENYLDLWRTGNSWNSWWPGYGISTNSRRGQNIRNPGDQFCGLEALWNLCCWNEERRLQNNSDISCTAGPRWKICGCLTYV